MLPDVRFRALKLVALKLIAVPSGASVMAPVLPEPSDRVAAASRPSEPAGIESVSVVGVPVVTSIARPALKGCSAIVPPGTEMMAEVLSPRVSVSVVSETVRPAGAVMPGPPKLLMVSGTAVTIVMSPVLAASGSWPVPTLDILFTGLFKDRDATVPATLLVAITLPAPCVTGPAPPAAEVGAPKLSPLGAVRLPRSETPPTPALSVMAFVTLNVTPGSTRTKLPPSNVRDCALPMSVTEEDATTLLVACTVTSPTVASRVAGVMTVPGPPWSLTVMSAGSINTRPTWPAGAPVSIRLPIARVWPEISIAPPSPPALPPRAVRVPFAVVLPVLTRPMVPPRPFWRALAAIRAPASIVTLVAAGARTVVPPRTRAALVPIAIVPPPMSPLAVTWAGAATRTAPVAWATTVPPGPRPSAATRPSICTDPPMPDSTIVPVRPSTVLAWMRPPDCTSVCTSPSAAAAVRSTVPPSARIVPLLVTSATTGLPSGPLGTWRTWRVMSIDSSPSPYRSSVWVSAPARMTWPSLAWITPELATRGATSAASPASRTVMVPAFETCAPGFGAWSNTMRPAMKLAGVIPAALTISPAVSTCAPL